MRLPALAAPAMLLITACGGDATPTSASAAAGGTATDPSTGEALTPTTGEGSSTSTGEPVSTGTGEPASTGTGDPASTGTGDPPGPAPVFDLPALAVTEPVLVLASVPLPLALPLLLPVGASVGLLVLVGVSAVVLAPDELAPSLAELTPLSPQPVTIHKLIAAAEIRRIFRPPEAAASARARGPSMWGARIHCVRPLGATIAPPC